MTDNSQIYTEIEYSEMLDEILLPLPDKHKKTVTLMLQGYTKTEAAEKMNRTRHTIDRYFSHIRTLHAQGQQ